jgi:hypothetical protein
MGQWAGVRRWSRFDADAPPCARDRAHPGTADCPCPSVPPARRPSAGRALGGSSLSPEANRLLTEELWAVVGRDDVEVAADAPRRTEERHGTHSRFVATLLSHRQILLVTLLAAIVVGGIVSLSTGAYWAVLVAVGLHAFGTMVVVAAAVQLTTEVEHVAPETAARLEAEGVADPDRALTELVEDFAGAERAGGVLRSWRAVTTSAPCTRRTTRRAPRSSSAPR